jgi:hypothetical protein
MEKKLSEISEKLFSGRELTSAEATIVCNALKTSSPVVDDTPPYKKDEKDILLGSGFNSIKEGKYAIVDLEELLKKEIRAEIAQEAIENIEKLVLSDWKVRRILIGYALGAAAHQNDPLRGLLNRFLR